MQKLKENAADQGQTGMREQKAQHYRLKHYLAIKGLTH
jgi:hypothetical protein